MDMTINNIRDTYRSVRTAIKRTKRDWQGYYIKDFSKEQAKKIKSGFDPFICYRNFVGGDLEVILPSGTKVLTHTDYYILDKKLHPEMTTITKKITRPDGTVLLSRATNNGDRVNIYECKSTGNDVNDVKNLRNIFSFNRQK